MTLLLVLLTAIVLTVALSAVAWNSSREERRRSEARIAALAADIHDEPLVGPAIVGSSGDLFTTRHHVQGGSRFASAVAAGLFVCGSVAALAVVSSSASGQAPLRSGAGVAGRETQPATIEPIELVALGHERNADRLTVRGVVRNPLSGAALDRVAAVVLVFKEDGGFVGSGRASVDSSVLGPGAESAFTVTVPGASHVGRYRVSFRTEDRVVPHVDRRGKPENVTASP
jgi:hypothetical protein